MPKQTNWDKYEIALLIDACEDVYHGAIRQVVVKKLSAQLRQRAQLHGHKIDDIFRNESGISLQMSKMDYLLTDGKKGIFGAGSNFINIVSLKQSNHAEFSSILHEAKRQVSKERSKNAMNINNRELFSSWIKQQEKLKAHPNIILSVLDDSSEYALSHGISKESFWALGNSSIFVHTYRKLSSNKLFRVFMRNTAKTLDKVFIYYADFLDHFNNDSIINEDDPNINHNHIIESESTITNDNVRTQNPELYDQIYSALKKLSLTRNWGVSILSIHDEVGGSISAIKSILDNVSWATNREKKYFFLDKHDSIQLKTATPPGNSSILPATTDNEFTINFQENTSLSFTKPTSFTYLGNKYDDIRSWTDLYVKLFSLIYSDHKEKITSLVNGASGISFSDKQNGRIDFAYKEQVKTMRSPKQLVSDNAYIETNLSATNIVDKIKNILVLLSIPHDNVVITYKHAKSNDNMLKERFPSLYGKLYSMSKIYDNPEGLTIEYIGQILSIKITVELKENIIEILNNVSWATKITDNIYSFSKTAAIKVPVVEKIVSRNVEPNDFDKGAFIRVLMSRYQSGMQFDSIDLENFRDTYEDMYDEKLSFSDEELEARLKCCGILYKDRLFPTEGIIDNGTKEKLFTYIENKFAAGNKVLYYKAIFSDLADAFAYCFSLTDEQMLKAYIEHTAEKGKYYFQSNFMSTEKNVKIDHSAEIEDFMLAAGKPLSYDEVYEGLSHISQDIVYREIRSGSKFLMNARECYYHIDIFEFSESDGDKIAEIFNKEIEENGYVIWSKVFDTVKEQMPIFIENNLYLSPLGIRNALSRFMAERFDFDGEVISTYGSRLGMADVFRLYAKHNTPFSDTDLYDFSKSTDTTIYFWALAEESVRVSKNLFVAKDQIEFDIEATDKALETYLSSGYILVKDVDSFLVFPNVGYEWNEFLLESYLLHYSKKFCLVNNGISLNNVAGAVAKKDGNFTQFVDICAQALADSGIELKKTVALNYLADINLITRRSYKELDVAMTKARQIRNRKG